MYKLTTPVTIIDIEGNVKETEKTLVFSSKEELCEFIHGDNFGSCMLRLQKIDRRIYENIGKMCERIIYLLLKQIEFANKPIDAQKDPLNKPAIKSGKKFVK